MRGDHGGVLALSNLCGPVGLLRRSRSGGSLATRWCTGCWLKSGCPSLAPLAARAWPCFHCKPEELPWSPPCWAEVSGVYLGAVPIVMLGHVEELYKLGVRATVNMQDEYGGPVSEYARLGIAQAHFPTVDHVEPSLAALESAVEFIKAHRAKGHKVYVHCKGGHGRGAAVAFAWMLHIDGLGLQETQNRLSAIRNVRAKLWRQPNIVRFHAQQHKSDSRK